jgi:hypothetical protein
LEETFMVRRSFARVGWALGLLLAGVPLAGSTTLLLLPLWRWVEGRLAIEAVGHSGPADWCFEVVYAVWLGLGAILWFRRRSRGPQAGAPVV